MTEFNTDEEQIISLTNSLLTKGDLEVQAGNLDAAQSAYSRAKETSRLIGTDDNGGFAIACDKLGDLAREAGRISVARDEYSQALPIFRKLAAQRPRYRRDLSLCLSKIGELALSEGKVAFAKATLEEHFALAKQIADTDPTETEHQRDFAGAHSRLQHLAGMTGNLNEALRHAEACHEIMEKLVRIDPGNTSWVQDLAGSDCVFAMLLGQAGDTKRAVSLLKGGYGTLRRLADAGKLDSKGRRLYKQLREQLDALG